MAKARATRGVVTDKLQRINPIAQEEEWRVSFARIAAGSSVEQEAERLGVEPAGFYSFVQRDEDVLAAFQQALAFRAESDHERRRKHAIHMLESSEDYTKEQVAAKREGLKTLGEIAQVDNRERFGSQVTHKVQAVPPNLKEWLTQIEQTRKREALAGPVVDAEFTEVKDG